MFIVKGKSEGPGKRKIYVFDLWWKMSCTIGVEATSRKEAEEIMALEGDKGNLDLSDTDTTTGASGTKYMGIKRD